MKKTLRLTLFSYVAMTLFISCALLSQSILPLVPTVFVALLLYETRRIQRAENWKLEVSKRSGPYGEESLSINEQVAILDRSEEILLVELFNLWDRIGGVKNARRVKELKTLITEIHEYRSGLILNSNGQIQNVEE